MMAAGQFVSRKSKESSQITFAIDTTVTTNKYAMHWTFYTLFGQVKERIKSYKYSSKETFSKFIIEPRIKVGWNDINSISFTYLNNWDYEIHIHLSHNDSL